MSTGQNLRDLLAPLGVYRWEGSFQWGELQSEGEALDKIAEELAWTQREMHLMTAREEGLSGWQTLLSCQTGSQEPEDVRAALAALLRVGSGSFTLAAVNDALQGCGVPVRVEETGDPLKLSVSFPGSSGVPADFARMQPLIQNLLPCHVLVEYQFQYRTWADLEARFPSWNSIEEAGVDWGAFEGQSL